MKWMTMAAITLALLFVCVFLVINKQAQLSVITNEVQTYMGQRDTLRKEVGDLQGHRDRRVALDKEWEEFKTKEGELILKNIRPGEDVILLDERGKQYTSVELAKVLQDKISYIGKDITFVIGGAYGFSQAVYERADSKISLSKMTFSHQMVRAIFVEQIYRAFTIMRGEPYHHE
jgi:rRNA large subunit m3Psi methyltransferase RlmH